MTADGTHVAQSALESIAQSSPSDAVLDAPDGAADRRADGAAVSLHFGIPGIAHRMLDPGLDSLAGDHLINVESKQGGVSIATPATGCHETE